MRKIKSSVLLFIYIITFVSSVSAANPILQSTPVKTEPQIDGKSGDSVWASASELITYDAVAKKNIKVKSVYTKENIFMIVQFKEEAPSYQHKNLYWNEKANRYITGTEREDTFIFKWNMLPVPTDISLSSNTPYKADIWYWKSARTNHAGYADDKIQIYQLKKVKRSRMNISKDGSYFYLIRKGDKGKAAYKPRFYIDKELTSMPKYNFVTPVGSRSDIEAKGKWENGIWTIEFKRALNTKHNDDLQFSIDSTYYFGVSRFEIAGRKIDPEIGRPLFGAGDINELIKLEFVK